MSRDANGNYTLPSGNPVSSGSVIASTWANPTMSDIASELTDSLSRSGAGGMLAPLGLVDGSAALPAMAFSSEPASGWYRAGTNDLRLSINTADTLAANATGVVVSATKTLTASAGGSLTGTWSDLGTVTTMDLDGGTIDGTVIGGASAAAGTFTTGNFSGSVYINGATNTLKLSNTGNPSPPSLSTIGDMAIFSNQTNGVLIAGNGGTNDVWIGNKNYSTVMQVPTGTVNATFAGDVTVTEILDFVNDSDTDRPLSIQATSNYLKLQLGTAGLLIRSEDTLTNHLLIDDATGNANFAGNIGVAATKGIFLDGIGDTYIYESSANVMEFWTGATKRFSISSTADEAGIDSLGMFIQTAAGFYRTRHAGVDGTFNDVFRMYNSGNDVEYNGIGTTVSSIAQSSGFAFNVSNGGGSSAQTNMFRVTRAGIQVYNGSAPTTTASVLHMFHDGSSNSVILTRGANSSTIGQINFDIEASDGSGAHRMSWYSAGLVIHGGGTGSGEAIQCWNDGSGNPAGSFAVSSDGTVMNFRTGGASGAVHGTISISGTTTSYNAFSGSHFSAVDEDYSEEILRGTVMETRDVMMPDKEQLVQCQVSTTPKAKNVYGVFSVWRDDPDTMEKELQVTSIGAFVVRIDPNETVQMGDYLESAGNGCAQVQDDDILRASTIAKVTGTTKVYEYDDGSYCVPCTLHCG